jgi:hypothetical protein
VPYFATIDDIAGLGQAAVPPLVQRVKRAESPGEIGHVNGAMDALEQMLEQSPIRPTLSPASRLLIRQVATDDACTLRNAPLR